MPKFHPPTPHYNRAAIQPIDFAEAWFSQPGYDGYSGMLCHQVLKYLSRFPFKGTAVDDLTKAATYLTWLTEYVINREEKDKEFAKRMFGDLTKLYAYAKKKGSGKIAGKEKRK